MATYNISTLAQLQAISSHLADDCILLNDIDASATRTWNEVPNYSDNYYGFQPVGTFTGTFDGQGHTITNLYINRTTEFGTTPTGYNTCGMLGAIHRGAAAGGFIKDVSILNADITGWEFVGILASTASADAVANMVIENVTTSGTVNIKRTSGGGFIGFCTVVTFTNCGTSATVTKSSGALAIASKVGGFCSNTNADFTNCSASGSVSVAFTDTTNTHFIGGFSGELSSTAVRTLTGCTATGNVTANISTTGTVYVGGFAGYTTGANLTVTTCFAYGNVRSSSASPANVGGFVGFLVNCDNISKCGATGDVESVTTSSDPCYNNAGGFVGYDTGGDIANCFANGAVCSEGIGHTSAAIGGFVGRTTSVTFSYCYSSGLVYSTGTPTNGGGFCGLDFGTNTFTDCFWDTETSGWTTTDGDATGKTTTQMKTKTTFTNWDFDDVWMIATYTRTPGTGTTVWLSEVADYEDFEEGVNDSDSFSVTLPTTNNIMWVEALESMIAGTGGDEWKIASNDFGTPITPTNHTIRQQTNYGSKAMQALKVNESILFVDFVGRKIRELTYSEEFGKHVAPDLSSLAEHITYSGITSIAHQKNPDSILWCTLTDGSLISMTYERDQNVVAWSDHPIDGDVQSVCVIPGSAEDEVWLTVKRTMTGVNSGVFVIYIERMASRTFTDIDDCFFVDSGRTIEHSYAATTTISGLLHLEGETVALLGDGVDLSTYTVSSGVITASTAVTTAQVGLAYTSKLQPMKPVVETQMGTSAASIVKVSEMGISLLDSAGVKYGTSDSALYDIDLDDARWVNLSEITGLFSGTVAVAIDGGFSLEAPLIISSSSPLPVCVRALIPRMDVCGR